MSLEPVLALVLQALLLEVALQRCEKPVDATPLKPLKTHSL
jgi:hypothetical protein